MKPQISQMTQISNKDPETYAIIGAAMKAHAALGHGFLEAVYQEVLALEFDSEDINYRKEVIIPIVYKGQTLNTNYLRATKIEKRLLLNFGSPSLEYKRLILSEQFRQSAQSVVSPLSPNSPLSLP